MWGITARGVRLSDSRRSARALHAGLARVTVRGPLEHAVLEIAGELDFADVDTLLEVAASVPHHVVSIDLAGLDFVDGAGARALERLRDDRERLHGERPAVIGATRTVDRTLRFVRARMSRLVTH